MNEKADPDQLQNSQPATSDGRLMVRLSDLENSLRQDLQHMSTSMDLNAIKLSLEINKLNLEVHGVHRDLSRQVSSQIEKTGKLSEEIHQIRGDISSLHGDLSEVLSLLKGQQSVSCVTKTETNLSDSETPFQSGQYASQRSECEKNSELHTTLQPKQRVTQENRIQVPFRIDLSDTKFTSSPNIEIVSATLFGDVSSTKDMEINLNSMKPARVREKTPEREVLGHESVNDKGMESMDSESESLLPVTAQSRAITGDAKDDPNKSATNVPVCVGSKTCCGHLNSISTICSDCFNTVSSTQTSPAVKPVGSLSSAATASNCPIRSATSSTQAASSDSSHSSSDPAVFTASGNTSITSNQEMSDLNNTKVEPPSTPMVPISLLPTEEVNRYRNSVLIQKLIPDALQTLLGWLSQDKLPDQSFLWYIKYVTNLSAEQLKKKYISALEMNALRGNDMSVFDVTLLVKLIKLLAKISDCDHVETDHDDTSASCLLWKLKNYRNLVSHKIKTSSTNADIFTAAKNSLLSLFSIIDNVKFNIEKKVVEDQVSKLREAFENVANTDCERQCIERTESFRTESFKESKSYWGDYCMLEPVPFAENIVDSQRVFHPMEIFVQQRTETIETILSKESYKHILKRANEDGRKATILVGEAGSGKTTVVKNIALQFLGLIDPEVDFLSEIHLLLFLECRDRFTNTVEKALWNNFPKACRKISTEKAVECFCFLGNLIIIDGYDEVNESSSAIISQVIRLLRSMSACQLLFTSRPHKAAHLKELLSSNGIPFTTFELVPLSEEHDQLQFLQRYEMNMSHNKPVLNGMVETFQGLLPEVKEFFIYPINLVLFYFLYCNSRDHISSWETSNDVIEQILVLYEIFIARKLRERHLTNLDRFICEALEEVYKFAFRCISENKIMLSSEDIRPVQECLENKFREWQLISKLDTGVVTSVVFLTKTVPNPTRPVVYQFFHKGIMEIMAARTFVKSMKKESHLILKQLLLGGSDMSKSAKSKSAKTELSRYENVLLFVMSYLSQPENLATLVSRTDELLQLFVSFGVKMKFCSEMLLCKPQSAPLTDLCVSLVKSLDYFEVETHREYRAMAIVLPHFHPEVLHVSQATGDELPSSIRELLLVVKETFFGKLEIILRGSYRGFIPVDSLVTDIMPSRFTLTSFCGCLATKQGMQSLSLQLNLSEDPVYVAVSTPRPYAHHFELLQNYRSGSAMRVRYEDPPIGQLVPCALLPNDAEFSIADTHEHKYILGLILALAPENRRFYHLTLEDCGITEIDLKQMIENLQRTQISTSTAMSTKVEKLGFMYGFCVGCSKEEHLHDRRCIRLNIKRF